MRNNLLALIVLTCLQAVDHKSTNSMIPQPINILKSGTVTYSFANTSSLGALTAIAAEYKMPLGIILGVDRDICTVHDKIEISALTPEQAMHRLAGASKYELTHLDKVYSLIPRALTVEEKRILSLDIGDFNPPPTNFHTLASFLWARTRGTLHPAEGVAGSVLSPFGAREIRFRVGPHATPKIVADKLISDEGPGLWIIAFVQPAKPDGVKTEDLDRISIYSYEDDAYSIDHLQCPQ